MITKQKIKTKLKEITKSELLSVAQNYRMQRSAKYTGDSLYTIACKQDGSLRVHSKHPARKHKFTVLLDVEIVTKF